MQAMDRLKQAWRSTRRISAAVLEGTLRLRHLLLLLRVRRWRDHMPDIRFETWPAQLLPLTRSELAAVMPPKDAKAALKRARNNKAFAERVAEVRPLLEQLADNTAILTLDLKKIVPKAAFRPHYQQVLARARGPWSRGHLNGIWTSMSGGPKIQRAVCDLQPRELAALKASAIFYTHTGNRKVFDQDRAEIIYGEGRATHRATRESQLIIDGGLQDYLCQLEQVVAHRLAEAQSIVQNQANTKLAHDLRPLVQTGQSWSEQIEPPFTSHRPGETLALGRLPDGRTIGYEGNESLITIGGPGSGKTQAHVIPNVVSYGGPVIVLDLKGEVFAATAGYRQQRRCRILRFSLQGDTQSHGYNPLDQLSRDPDEVYDSAHRLAELIIVRPARENDPFWVNSARDLLAAVIAAVLVDPDVQDKTFTAVLDRIMLSGAKRLAMLDRIESLGRLMGIRPLAYAGDSLRSLAQDSDRTFEGIAQQARQALTPFGSALAEQALAKSDWHPAELRDPGTSLYLTIPQDKLEFFAPIMRVLIAQHLDAATKAPVEATNRLPITLFLDELPQLGNFEQVIKAVELGRGYGVRVWGFAQNTQQIETSFERANILLEGVGVRSFLSIDQDAAERLSRALGDTVDIISGERRPLATVAALMGPEFRGKGIILGRNANPLKAEQSAAWQDHADDLGLPYRFTPDGYAPYDV